jgi:CHAT domain-containing protein
MRQTIGSRRLVRLRKFMLLKKIRSVLYFAFCFTLLPLTWQYFHSTNSKAALAQPKPISQTVAQPITFYQPLQHLSWQGTISKTGIAYFPVEGFANEFTADADRAISLSGIGSESDLEAARAMKDAPLIAKNLAALGLSRHLQGEYDQAINYYKQGLEIAKGNSDSTLKLTILGNLGLASVQAGDYYADTIDYLNEYATLTQGHQKIQALGNLANAYFGADLYIKAIALQQQRLTLSQKANDQNSVAKTLGDLGIVYQALGESAKAIKYQEQALTLAQQLKDRSLESFVLGNLGIIYQTQHNYVKATEYQQQRLIIARQLKDLRGEAETLGNLGGIAYFQGDNQGAMAQYNQAIAQYAQAWKISWNTLHDANILYRIRGNQGLIYAQMGNNEKALELYQQYFQYASSRSSRREEGIAKINTAAVLVQSGNLAGAAKTLREAIASWESLRSRLGNNDRFKISIFETQNAPYSNLQSVLIAQNQPEAALEISERGRARAIAELLARRLSNPPQKAVFGLPLASPTVAQIKQIAQNHRATLVEYSIIPGQFNVKGRLETHDSELLIWVIQPTGKITLRRVDLKPLWQCSQLQTCNSKELSSLTSISRIDLSVKDGGAPSPLHRLHELLIKPIADLLPTDPNAQVIFIPHRSLLLVPFAALQDAQGKFLIEQHTISISPSIQVLDLTEQLRRRLRSIQEDNQKTSQPLIVGNPTMPKVVTEVGEVAQQLSPLPGAEREAIAIANLLKSSALIGGAAKKANVLQLMSHARMIHLATHGLMSDSLGLGMPGAIALAPDSTPTGNPSVEENGLLTSDEIVDLKLNARLVVLSACNTGRGRVTGDGVVGLSRALIAAQVPSMVVSLWSVPDQPTSLLMTEFYRNIQRQPDQAQALRQAMLTTMKQHPAPFDWSAFMLIGEAN